MIDVIQLPWQCWREEHVGLKVDQVKRLKDKERLGKAIPDRTLEKLTSKGL